MNSENAAAMIFASFGMFIFVFIFVLILVGIGFFVIKAFGFYKIAQRKGIDHAWLAWIPFAQTYLYAEIIGEELVVGKTKIPHFPWLYIAVMFGSSIISGILSLIPIIGWLLALMLGPVLFLINIYIMYRFFRIFTGDNEVVNTVICTIFPVVFPVMVLVMRNKPFATDNVIMKTVQNTDKAL